MTGIPMRVFYVDSIVESGDAFFRPGMKVGCYHFHGGGKVPAITAGGYVAGFKSVGVLPVAVPTFLKRKWLDGYLQVTNGVLEETRSFSYRLRLSYEEADISREQAIVVLSVPAPAGGSNSYTGNRLIEMIDSSGERWWTYSGLSGVGIARGVSVNAQGGWQTHLIQVVGRSEEFRTTSIACGGEEVLTQVLNFDGYNLVTP